MEKRFTPAEHRMIVRGVLRFLLSQTFTVRSSLPETTTLVSGVKLAEVTTLIVRKDRNQLTQSELEQLRSLIDWLEDPTNGKWNLLLRRSLVDEQDDIGCWSS